MHFPKCAPQGLWEGTTSVVPINPKSESASAADGTQLQSLARLSFPCHPERSGSFAKQNSCGVEGPLPLNYVLGESRDPSTPQVRPLHVRTCSAQDDIRAGPFTLLAWGGHDFSSCRPIRRLGPALAAEGRAVQCWKKYVSKPQERWIPDVVWAPAIPHGSAASRP